MPNVKTFLAAILIWIASFASLHAAIIITNVGTASNTTGATLTETISVPAGVTVFVIVTEQNGLGTVTSVGTVSDSVNGAYTAEETGFIVGSANYGVGGVFIFSNSAVLSSATLTYTKNKSTSEASISVFYATGVSNVSPLDSAVTASAIINTNGGGGTAPGTPTTVSGTPSVAGELFLAAVITSPFTQGNASCRANWFSQDTADGWATPPVGVFSNTNTTSLSAVYGGTQINAGTGTKSFTAGNVSNLTQCFGFQWVLGFKPGSTGNLRALTGVGR